MFDIQYDLTDQRWSRFAFGGINALVYDDVLHANGEGGGPVIDPSLVVLGLGAAGVIYMLLNNNNNDTPHECNDEQQVVNFTLNLHEPCELPQD